MRKRQILFFVTMWSLLLVTTTAIAQNDQERPGVQHKKQKEEPPKEKTKKQKKLEEKKEKEKWHLEWSEGFEHLDQTVWNVRDIYKTGGSTGFNPANVHTDNGHLILTLSAEPYMEKEYSGGEVYQTKEIAYGRLDIKIKAPKGQGISCSVMASSTVGNERRAHDEISILFRGAEPKSIHFNYFKRKDRPENSNSYYLPYDVSEDFHVYSIERTHKYIKWYIDGKLYYQTYEHIPASSMHLVFSIWKSGGMVKDEAQQPLPADFLIDYVKYFTRNK